MKQRLIIFGVFVLMALILVALNAASYTQRQKEQETEMFPNRSTFNPGPTGSQAFYTLLSETGRKVVRWQEPVDGLETKRKDPPSTFVVIGSTRRGFTEPEITSLLGWVGRGGRLVLIDREPPGDLIKTTANWKIDLKQKNKFNLYDSDPSDQRKMTLDTPAAKPVQPSMFTISVNAVQPSQYASSIVFERFENVKQNGATTNPISPPASKSKLIFAEGIDDDHGKSSSGFDTANEGKPKVQIKKDGKISTLVTPTPMPLDDERTDSGDTDEEDVDLPRLFAPVAHIAAGGNNILVDAPFGSGRIVFLSDPYIVSNGGISLVDNAQLAINIVANGEGIVAFDEYHQGFGNDQNRLFQFFAGTPVVAIFFQCVLLIGLVFFSQSRRFGRPLPDQEPDRLSKLEYVGAMAELQQRTRAYDLAIENIYRDFRRRAARLLGVDNMSTPMHKFAVVIAERARADRKDVEDLMFKCEEIIAGEPTNKRQVLELTTRIRQLEQALGMRRRASK